MQTAIYNCSEEWVDA